MSTRQKTIKAENLNAEKRKPNIIIMYADDLGFGDIGCYGATQIPTPNLDRLASQGLLFKEGYSAAATCTPSRYSLLTGLYPWRNKSARILNGDAPLIIEPGSQTLPGMLKGAGYKTGVVGKWHLGLGDGKIDWNKDINPGPLDVGFDYSYIMASTNDRVPCVYIEGRRVDGLEEDDPMQVEYGPECPFPEEPTGRKNPELLRMMYSQGHNGSIVNGVSRIGYMKGGNAALWTDESMADVFLNKAIYFVNEHSAEPFFLYYAFHQPHAPRLPGPRFAGSTKLGPRGDVIAEMDWCVGEMIDKLDELGLLKDTIIIFSSDNGPVVEEGYIDNSEKLRNGHLPAGPLRGGKYSLYEGGTRVPFIVSWKGTVVPGKSSALVSQIDFIASFADLLNQPLQPAEAKDSVNILQALLGREDVGRVELVTEGGTAKTVLRQDNWVYIPPYNGPSITKNIELGNASYPQLYDLNTDTQQRRNLADENPSLIAEMEKRLKEIMQMY
ncbi:MAG TPA: arylsulfatase [Bacteroidales bacterium]|nr:arylsulfatase [Bacteroidales bacterium]